MEIKINGKKYKTKEGETVLEVCQRNGIRIPTLCHFEGLPKEQVCRLCLVETNRNSNLATSCGLKVEDGLEIETETEKVEKSRRINLELLWADHAGKCVTCYKNGKCELQSLAEEYKIENFHFVPRRDEMTKGEELNLVKDNLSREVVDKENPCIEKKGSLCVECRRCINICPTREFGFNFRSGDVKVETPFGKSLDCIFCGKCVEACPVASLISKNNFADLKKDLGNMKKIAVAVLDEEIFDNFEKEFKREITREQFLGLLKKMGFEKIFSLQLAQSEFNWKTKDSIESSKEKYLFSGENVSFNLFLEKYYPELMKHLVKIDFSEVIMSRWIKNNWAQQEKIDPENISLSFVSTQLAKKKLEDENKIDFVLMLSEMERLRKFLKLEIGEKAEINKLVLKDKFIQECEKPKARVIEGVENIKKTLDEIKAGKARKGFYQFKF